MIFLWLLFTRVSYRCIIKKSLWHMVYIMKRSTNLLIKWNQIWAQVMPGPLSEFMGRIVIICLFLGVLAAAAHTDKKTMTIPDKLVLAALGVSLCSIPFFPEIGLMERVLGIYSASLLLLVITLCVPGAFGGGDIKLMAVCGVFLGWRYSLLALAIAIFLGAVYGVRMLAIGKADRKSRIAFGPFLCIGMGIAVLWGEQVLSLLF